MILKFGPDFKIFIFFFYPHFLSQLWTRAIPPVLGWIFDRTQFWGVPCTTVYRPSIEHFQGYPIPRPDCLGDEYPTSRFSPKNPGTGYLNPGTRYYYEYPMSWLDTASRRHILDIVSNFFKKYEYHPKSWGMPSLRIRTYATSSCDKNLHFTTIIFVNTALSYLTLHPRKFMVVKSLSYFYDSWSQHHLLENSSLADKAKKNKSIST